MARIQANQKRVEIDFFVSFEPVKGGWVGTVKDLGVEIQGETPDSIIADIKKAIKRELAKAFPALTAQEFKEQMAEVADEVVKEVSIPKAKAKSKAKAKAKTK